MSVFDKFSNRYLIDADIVFEATFHVGIGMADDNTDSPVIRDAAGRPFVPGSSIKGLLRATVERLAPAVFGKKVRSCGLIAGAGKCLSVADKRDELYRKEMEKLKKASLADWEAKLAKWVDAQLCDTCKLFGSPYRRSKVAVDDARLSDVTDMTELEREIRDGVVIDRSTGAAADKLKYDYEVVPNNLNRYKLKIQVENADKRDLELLCLGLAEMVDGRLRLGGAGSRGQGAFRLEAGKVSWIIAADCEPKTMIAHLLRNKYPNEDELNKFLNDILAPQAGAVHA